VSNDSRFRLEPKYLTQEEVAKVLGLSAERARQLILEKKIQLVMRAVVPSASVRRFLAERATSDMERSR
jgi:hypothetical protein